MWPDCSQSSLVTAKHGVLLIFQLQTWGFRSSGVKDKAEERRGGCEFVDWRHRKAESCTRHAQNKILLPPLSTLSPVFFSLYHPFQPRPGNPPPTPPPSSLPPSLFVYVVLPLFSLWSVPTASSGLQEAVIHLPRIKQSCQQPDWHTKRPGCLHTHVHIHTHTLRAGARATKREGLLNKTTTHRHILQHYMVYSISLKGLFSFPTLSTCTLELILASLHVRGWKSRFLKELVSLSWPCNLPRNLQYGINH